MPRRPIFFATVAFLLGIWGGFRYFARWEDALWYREMAAGQSQSVIEPFAGRPLTPLLAKWIHRLSGISFDHSFEMIGLLSLVALAFVVFWLPTDKEFGQM